MTVAILRTMMQVLLRLSQKPFNRKPVSTHRVVWRHGGTGQMGMLPSILSRQANGMVNLYANAVAPRLACHIDDHRNEPFDSMDHQPALAFGVRLIC